MQLTVEMIEISMLRTAGEQVFASVYLPESGTDEYKKFTDGLWKLAVGSRARIVIRKNPLTEAYHVIWFPEDVRTVIWPSS